MSGWIKLWKDSCEDPRLAEAAEELCRRYLIAERSAGGGCDLSKADELRFASNALRGALVTLWCYADTHLRNGNRLPLSSQALDALVGIEGFCDIVPDDWVEVLDDGTVKLPGYSEKNDLIAKEKRASDAKARQAAWRARHNATTNASHNDIVTRDERITKCVDQDLDQDLDQSKRKNGSSAHGPRAPTATRLPPDFILTAERRAIAEAERIDADREFKKFTDHWLSASGAKARKHDWDATWRNWCRSDIAARAAKVRPPAQPEWHPPEDTDVPH